jgi:integrase
MGCVYQRGPNNWWIKWKEGGHTRYSHGYATRELAQQVLAKIVSDVAAGRAGLPPDPRTVPTLSELAEEWLKRRKQTHRAARDDKIRWNKHLKRFFGSCRPTEVDAAGIRRFVEAMLIAGMNAATVRLCVLLLSSFFADVVERGLAPRNPVRDLPRSTRRLIRPTTDPRRTPFIETLADVRRVYLSLEEPISVAFAIGALAGLRPGELQALDWRDIDLGKRRIHVHQQVHLARLGPLKDDEARIAPILNPLVPELTEWKLRTGGKGLVCAPKYPARGGRPGRPTSFIRQQTLSRHLAKALVACGLPALTWYQATRHSFASQWVLAGGSIEKLATILGHGTTAVTERYAHMRPDLFPEADYDTLEIDLGGGEAPVTRIDRKAP